VLQGLRGFANRARIGYQVPENPACSPAHGFCITERERGTAGSLGGEFHQQGARIERKPGIRICEHGRRKACLVQELFESDSATAEEFAIAGKNARADLGLA
jgi:hypothetical protein